MILIDTNILLHNPNIIKENNNTGTTIRVIEELDKLKNSTNNETAFKSRRASHLISHSGKNFHIYMDRNDKISVDDDLLRIAKKYKLILATNDLNLQIKAAAQKVEWIKYEKEESFYSGVYYLDYILDSNNYNEQLSALIESKKPPFDMEENSFVIARNDFNKDNIAEFIHQKGKFRMLNRNYIDSSYLGKISARNAEQNCFIELLNDTSITILLASGAVGGGKSLLSTAYALQQLEKDKINKIIYVPNNSFVENTREIGALPGDLFTKESLFISTLNDMLGTYTVDKLLKEDSLEIAPISTMRGRNFDNSIILVNEAQNLTRKHINLLITRCGNNTRIIFDGDVRQSDSYVFRQKNGLMLLNELRKSEKFGSLYGTVEFTKTERSLTAQAATFLDTIY